MSTTCFFISDLHGKIERFKKLFALIKKENPSIVFFGGDITPSFFSNDYINNFISDFLVPQLLELKKMKNYPKIYVILGNDDLRINEDFLLEAEENNLLQYIHNKVVKYGIYSIYGYSFVPPTPFQLKDWEKYDVSTYFDPGCTPPNEGYRSKNIDNYSINFSTIKDDLENLTKNQNLSKSIFLFHSPPYQTYLDRAALDDKFIDHIPLDVHIGSIAIKQFIENRQPYITLHGHVHESSSITGKWSQKIKNTFTFSAAYDKKELAIIKFDIEKPEHAIRILI